MTSRRSFLRASAAAGAAALVGTWAGVGSGRGWASPRRLRHPDSLPFPDRPAGSVDEAMPFDHLVVVMMENHSFDNLLGALPRMGWPVDGLTFDASGQALNMNTGAIGTVRSFELSDTSQGDGVDQSWNATHTQIDGGAMDGFVASTEQVQPMGYWGPAVLPFSYSLARSFTVNDRWFCSAPCQTYPNRRFLMAGTAYGDIATDTQSLFDPPPPNGTIFDRLHAWGISWANYFTDLPATGIIPSTVEKYPANIVPFAQFLADCAAGTLPAVSFVDPEFGALGDVGSSLAALPTLAPYTQVLQTTGGDEEAPQDMAYGEAWAARAIGAALASPAWRRTLVIWTYDEHGGYYDHVPPPPAIAPDDIPPELGPGDAPGGYDIYGPRVPAVVASPYAVPGGVTHVVHDHTSVLATIEAKWNLPALTYRDANAATVMDFLDPGVMAFPEPPTLAQPLPEPAPASLVPGAQLSSLVPGTGAAS